MNRVKRKLLVILLLILPLLLLDNCSGNNTGKITAPGIVDGDIITLKSLVTGTIQTLNIEEGDIVQKDNILVQIDSAKIVNQINELEINSRDIDIQTQSISNKMGFLVSNINYLQKQVERYKRLKEKSALPGEKLETMELKFKEARTTHFELKKSLESLTIQKEKIKNKQEYLHLLLNDHVIKSPVTGVVLEKFVSNGESVFPGTSIADVLDTSSLYVEIFLEEKELANLKLNQIVSISIDGRMERLEGTITFFGKKAEFSPKYIISEKERQSLLYQVKIKINDSESILKIGMPVTIIIDRT